MSELVTLTRDGEVGIITVNNPPVNALSPGVPEGISAAIEQVRNDASLKGAVMIGAGQTFIAGADIREFGKITSGERKRGIEFLNMLLSIEDCPKPVVAAIAWDCLRRRTRGRDGLSLPRRRALGASRPARG